MKCKSGKHEWTRAEDAEKCCNGYRRILAIGQDLAPADPRAGVLPGGQVYGFQWAPIGEESPHMRPHDGAEGVK